MAKCSYAQNREDILIARVFPERDGFYVDVGAADPVEHSVTKYFSELGWTGINIEPQPAYFERLVRDRVDDVNLNVVIADQPGSLVLNVAPTHPGFSTIDARVAAEMNARSIETDELVVEAMTLSQVFERYVTREITFLKVDVEGAEARVLAGADFARWRPRLIVVEATAQNSNRRVTDGWHENLVDVGYRYATFDGLNNYYVRDEDHALVDVLRVPVNVLDDWYPYEYVAQVVDASARRRQAEDRLVRVRRALIDLRRDLKTTPR